MAKNSVDPPFVIHGTLHMQGWLWKQKSNLQASKLGLRPKWTRRWVVLDDKAVYWFKNDDVHRPSHKILASFIFRLLRLLLVQRGLHFSFGEVALMFFVSWLFSRSQNLQALSI